MRQTVKATAFSCESYESEAALQQLIMKSHSVSSYFVFGKFWDFLWDVIHWSEVSLSSSAVQSPLLD